MKLKPEARGAKRRNQKTSRRFTLHISGFTFRSGNILPLALVMTLTILMAGIGIGAVVLEGSKRAVATDQSVTAYYMADSGVERELYDVRKKDAIVSDFATLVTTYPNSSSWKFVGGYDATTTKSIATVSTSSFAVVDLFNPDSVSGAGVSKLVVTWADASSTCVGAKLEAGYSLLDVSSGFLPQNFSVCRQETAGFNPSCAVSGNIITLTLDPTKAYRVRLRGLICPAGNVRADAQTAGGAPVTFPGDVTLSAEGTYGKATQRISVTMPKTNILSGVFSYVIFSECTLVKGTDTPTCPP